MRQIGTIENAAHAKRFAAYLLTQGIEAHAEADNAAWAIWVRDENQVGAAREEMSAFKLDPASGRYSGVERKATAISREQEKKRDQAQKNVVHMSGRWGTASIGSQRRPITLVMILLCIGVFLFSFGGPGATPGVNQPNILSTPMRALQFADPIHLTQKGWSRNSADGQLTDIRRGQVWRLVTPIFLHFSIWHLFFNLYIFYFFGGQVENYYGGLRYGLLILALAIFSNVAQFLAPPFEFAGQEMGGNPFGGGMSGVVYGLFGFIWVKSWLEPASGFRVSPFLTILIFGQFFLGIFGVLDGMMGRNIAHLAHGGGLLLGVLVALAGQLSPSSKSE